VKKVTRTGNYSIYQKRSGRYAVQDKAKNWVNAEEKTKILLEAGLIGASAPKPVPSDEPEEDVTEEAVGNADGGEETAS
jgi:hypothetical protein